MTKKKKNSVVTGRSRVSGAMAGKEGQVGAGPPGPQSAIPQAPSLHAQEVVRRGRVKLERAGPTWPCIMPEPNECFRRALKLR